MIAQYDSSCFCESFNVYCCTDSEATVRINRSLNMENTVYDSSVSLHWYDSYCLCESLYLYYCTNREATVRIKRPLKIWRKTVYDSSVSLHWYDGYYFCESLKVYNCSDNEATVQINKSLKIWRILSIIALFLSIGMIIIAFVKAYTCIIV